MFYGGLPSRLCQLGTPRYIGKEHATPSSHPKLSGKSCHTTTRTNQYNEHIKTITLARVKYRIDFKVATLTYKVLQTGEPSYLSSRISVDIPRRVLRSSTDTCRLAIPQFKTKISSRAFRHSAPSIWNSLPFYIRNSPYTQSLKKR